LRSSISARALQRLHLADQLRIQHRLGGAHVVALLAVEACAREGGDQLIAAHADVPVDAPQRQHEAVLAERAIPRDGVVVVRVDQRAVDVQDRRAHDGYAALWPSLRTDLRNAGATWVDEEFAAFHGSVSSTCSTPSAADNVSDAQTPSATPTSSPVRTATRAARSIRTTLPTSRARSWAAKQKAKGRHADNLDALSTD
jgi:hypothetical protein